MVSEVIFPRFWGVVCIEQCFRNFEIVIGSVVSEMSRFLVLDTFENSSAERVPSECSQFRYIADIFNKDIYVTSLDILPIYFTKTYFKTSTSCGSKKVNQSGPQNMTKKSKNCFS